MKFNLSSKDEPALAQVNETKSARPGSRSPFVDLRPSTVRQYRLNQISNSDSFSLASSRLSSPIAIQRKVSKFTANGEDKDTVVGAIKNAGLENDVVINNNFNVSDETFARATDAKAIVSKSNDKKNNRGDNTPAYNMVGTLGKLELQALSPIKGKKLFDIGHLIADVFFDNDQKQEAYVAENLTPMATDLNTGAFKSLFENNVNKDRKNGAEIDVEVDAVYADDAEVTVGTLMDRQAVQWTGIGKKKSPTKRQAARAEKLTVPRRFPKTFNVARETIKEAPIPKSATKKKKNEIENSRHYERTKTQEKDLKRKRSKSFETPSQYSDEQTHTIGKIKYKKKKVEQSFKQEVPYLDPDGEQSLSEVALSLGRLTEKQKLEQEEKEEAYLVNQFLQEVSYLLKNLDVSIQKQSWYSQECLELTWAILLQHLLPGPQLVKVAKKDCLNLWNASKKLRSLLSN